MYMYIQGSRLAIKTEPGKVSFYPFGAHIPSNPVLSSFHLATKCSILILHLLEWSWRAFQHLKLISFWQLKIMRDLLVRATLTTTPHKSPGNYPCEVLRCKTCPISMDTDDVLQLDKYLRFSDKHICIIYMYTSHPISPVDWGCLQCDTIFGDTCISNRVLFKSEFRTWPWGGLGSPTFHGKILYARILNFHELWLDYTVASSPGPSQCWISWERAWYATSHVLRHR